MIDFDRDGRRRLLFSRSVLWSQALRRCSGTCSHSDETAVAEVLEKLCELMKCLRASIFSRNPNFKVNRGAYMCTTQPRVTASEANGSKYTCYPIKAHGRLD